VTASGPLGIDPFDLVDPERFAVRGAPHDVFARLRAEAPVARFEPEGWIPFWAVTRYADVVTVASQPERFSNEHGLILMREGAVPQPMEMVVTLDPPRHGPMRRVAIRRFTPRAVRARHGEIERITTEVLDRAAAATDGEFDFVEHVAAPLPIAVISWLLGVPESDWDLLFGWTNEIIGKDDPEFRRPGESPGQTLRRARGELHGYIEAMIDERRRHPGDDVVSHLLVSEIDGRPLTHEQLLNFCELMIEAGNETTRNAISGGMIAFAEHPGAWARLSADPTLGPGAVEEVMRWVSPIVHFARTATEDCVLGGQSVRAGDTVAIFFASANRDDEQFGDGSVFRIDRSPNPHVAFGFGEHFCMGAHLARVEMETVFRHLIARMGDYEVVGYDRLASNVNGGIKHLHVRARLT